MITDAGVRELGSGTGWWKCSLTCKGNGGGDLEDCIDVENIKKIP